MSECLIYSPLGGEHSARIFSRAKIYVGQIDVKICPKGALKLDNYRYSHRIFKILKKTIDCCIVNLLHCVTEIFFRNTQLMSMIISYVFLAAESKSDISFSPTRLDLAVQGVGNVFSIKN